MVNNCNTNGHSSSRNQDMDQSLLYVGLWCDATVSKGNKSSNKNNEHSQHNVKGKGSKKVSSKGVKSAKEASTAEYHDPLINWIEEAEEDAPWNPVAGSYNMSKA